MATTMDQLVDWVHTEYMCEYTSEARDYLYKEAAMLACEKLITDAECVAMVTAIAATEDDPTSDAGMRNRLLLDLRSGALLASALRDIGSPPETRRVARSLRRAARKA